MRHLLIVVFAAAPILMLGCGDTHDVEPTPGPSLGPTPSQFTAGPTSPANTPTRSDYDDLTIVNLLGIPQGVPPSGSIVVETLEKWGLGNSPPRFSPDGTRFWSRTGDGLVVGAADRSEEMIVEPDGFFAAWAPDSERLAVAIGREAYGNQEPVSIYLMAPDGSDRVELGDTEAPLEIQFLPNGELLYVLDSELHAYDSLSAQDSVVAAIPVDGAPHDTYMASPDGQSIALLLENALSIVDRSSGAGTALSSTIEARGASPLAWSDDSRLLIYSYTTGFRIPEIAAFDRVTGTSTVLVTGKERGTFAGMQLVGDRGWMVFAFYPAGSVIDVGAEYQALNLYTGQRADLFTGGLGLQRLSADGTMIGVSRTGSTFPEDERGSWVARISW
jgi:hypothetical protein